MIDGPFERIFWREMRKTGDAAPQAHASKVDVRIWAVEMEAGSVEVRLPPGVTPIDPRSHPGGRAYGEYISFEAKAPHLGPEEFRASPSEGVWEAAVVAAATSAFDTLRPARTESLPGESWLNIVGRIPFKALRSAVLAAVADMREECELARIAGNDADYKLAVRDGQFALVRAVGRFLFDGVKRIVAVWKLVDEIRKLIG